jgi:hypothetical protein
MKLLLSIASISALLIPFTSGVSAYSQDPRSCTDPRTQYPSNPPCLKSENPLSKYLQKLDCIAILEPT